MRLRYYRAAAALMMVTAIIATQLNAFAKTWSDVESYSKEIDLVTGLGLMGGENSKQFFPDDMVDNAELVRIVMKLRNSNSGDRQRRFIDVPKTYYAFDEIDEAVNLGYITVNEDRMFYPEEKASSGEALRLMLCVMNYKPYLDASNVSIRRAAQSAGLLDGVSLSAENITKGELAKIIYNSFSCNLMEMTGIKGLNMEYKLNPEKTTLSYHGWKMVEGRITANDNTSMYYSGEATGIGSVRIDDTIYREGNSYAGTLLGYSVEAVCTDLPNETDTVIYAVRAKKTNELTVDCEDIDKVSGMTFYYNNNKRVNLKADMCLIYNGTAVKFDSSLLNQRYGDITFISANGSNSYDIVLINAFESYSVASVSKSDRKIYLGNGMLNGRSYINVSDDPGRSVEYYLADGERTTLESVSAGNIISVYYAEGAREVIKIYISDKNFTAEMSGSSTTEKRGEQTMIFDGDEYIVGKNAAGAEKARIGEIYTVCLDYKGYIIEISDSVGTKNYAAILWVGYDDVEDSCIIKLLKADGKNENFYVNNEKFRLISGRTSEKLTQEELYKTAPGYRFTVVLYELDAQGRIKSLTVPTVSDKSNPLKNEGIFTVHGELAGNTTASYGSINGIGTVRSVIFCIPQGDEIEYDECSARTGGYFSAGSSYSNAVFYDVGIDAQAGAVLVRAKAGTSMDNFDSGIMVVKKTMKTVNYDNEPVTRITGFVNGQQLSLNVSSRDADDKGYVREYDINDVKCGDVLIFTTNSAGEISCYSVLYVDELESGIFKQICALGNGFSTTRECSIYHAYTRYVDRSCLTIEYGSDTVPAQVSNASNVIVYKVDRSGKNVEMGEYGDIMGTNYYTGVKGSEIILRTNRNGVVEVVIYEN